MCLCRCSLRWCQSRSQNKSERIQWKWTRTHYSKIHPGAGEERFHWWAFFFFFLLFLYDWIDWVIEGVSIFSFDTKYWGKLKNILVLLHKFWWLKIQKELFHSMFLVEPYYFYPAFVNCRMNSFGVARSILNWWEDEYWVKFSLCVRVRKSLPLFLEFWIVEDCLVYLKK